LINPIIYFTHPINGLLMILVPVALGIFLGRRFHLGWRLWWIGAATFILSQIGHIPFNIFVGYLFSKGILPSPTGGWQLPFQAIYLGLSAGMWEECSRYAAYRWWAKDARSWGKGLMLGAGHGGIESIILGGIVLYTFFYMLALLGSDLSQVVPPAQLSLAQQQVHAYWSSPWFATLLGALERCIAITFHLAASILVLQVFLRGHIRWLWLAVFLHATVDAVAVISAKTLGPYATEGILAAFAVVNLLIIFGLRTPEPEPEPEKLGLSPLLQNSPLLPELPETPDNLDQTRYT